MATTMVHVRVDEKTKQKAAKTLAGMGISVSDAVRMLLVRVPAEKALPFEVRIPMPPRSGRCAPPIGARGSDRVLPTRSSRNWGSDRRGPPSAAPSSGAM